VRSLPWLLAIFLVASLSTPLAFADEEYCPPPAEELSPTEYARALSLDLSGAIPTVEELQTIAHAGEVSDEFVDSLLTSDAFAQRVVRRHRELIWNNVSEVVYIDNETNLTIDRSGVENIYWRSNLATMYRGARVSCLDEPARFDGDQILTSEVDGAEREGWVEIVPYWAPDSTIRVCAFDAQTIEVSPAGTPCNSLDGHSVPECGCGPNLVYCRGNGSHNQVSAAFNEDVERRIADVVRFDRSYLELFTGTTMYVNGPLTHFLRYRTGFPSNSTIAPLPYDPSALPNLDWMDSDTWVEIEVGDHQAGILTSPAFLLRFATNRARANRFYDAFLCDPFTAPEGSLPAEVGRLEPDLQLRDGCNYCHSELEPAAAHWGRWSEQGAGYLDPAGFPPLREDCQQCALEGRFCGSLCDRFYVMNVSTSEEIPFLGWLRAYVFLGEDAQSNVDSGPQALALRGVVTGQLDRCVATRTAEWLLGRTIDPHAEADWVADLAQEFSGANYSYRELVRAVITSETYRRVR
jgi:hypothetical protein